MTVPLVSPLPTSSGRRARPGATLVVTGLLGLAAAVIGAVVWYFVLAPSGFQRFDFDDANRSIRFRQAGEYVLFEEGPGASAPALPPSIEVQLRAEQGRGVPVEDLVEPGTLAAPDAYDTPWHEGRAIARFEIEEAGTYRLLAFEVEPDDPAAYLTSPPEQLAVGRHAATTWLGRPTALVVLVLTPLGLGVAALAVGLHRRSSAGTGVGTVR
jgi:hypothetical protein